MNDNIIEVIKKIISRPQMFLKNKSSNNLFRFLDGYYFYKNSNKLRNCIDDFFWSNFLEYLLAKFDISNKKYTVEDILKLKTNSDSESFELFIELFNSFYVENLREITNLSNKYFPNKND
mgnify:CR=1 FL=1|jgi:hypothetical protein